jgi:subtilase family serine protease
MQPFFGQESRSWLTRPAASARTKRLVIGLFIFTAISPLMVYGVGSTPTASVVDLSPLVAQSEVTSPADPNQEISLVLVLPLKDAKAANEFVKRVSDPTDELYGKFLTPGEFAAKYGANPGDYTRLKSWAEDSKLKISQESVSRTTLTVQGTAAQFEALFNVQINNYRSPQGKAFYSVNTAPVIPSQISSVLSGVIGLSNSVQYAPLCKMYKKLGETGSAGIKSNTAGGSGPGGAYNADDLRDAYNIPLLGGTVQQTVAVFEQGGYAQSDVEKYFRNNHLPSVSVKPRLVNGYDGHINDPNIELEAVLDVDMVVGINPAVHEVLVYEDGNDPFGVALLDALTDVANDNLVQTWSISYGGDERMARMHQAQAENQIFVQMAAQGITVFVSSGDNGAYGDSGQGLNAPDPGAQPLITSVGGTTLFTGTDAFFGAEEVWNLLVTGLGATGGGVSEFWTIPHWQPRSVVTPNGGSATNRNVPDVAAVANPETGVAVYSAINGGWVQVGGTSVAAPIWAGYISLLRSARQTLALGGIGFFNPTLYKFAEAYYGQYGVLHDVFDGTNGNSTTYGIPGYSAGLGYDNCTGWGSMDGQGFADVFLTTPTKKGTPPGKFGGLAGTAQSTTANLSWNPASGATGYLVEATGPVDPIPLSYVSTQTSVVISGLTPNTTYQIAVLALNRSGSTRVSSEISLTTQ